MKNRPPTDDAKPPATAGTKQGASSGKWQAGKSGNPSGRKPGTGKIGKLRDSIAKDVPAIISGLTDAAKGGDVGAARLLLERVLPALKPVEEAIVVNMGGETLAERGKSALAAIADGQITPGQGATVLAALGTLAKLVETDELVRRIEALEQKHTGTAGKTWCSPTVGVARAPPR